MAKNKYTVFTADINFNITPPISTIESTLGSLESKFANFSASSQDFVSGVGDALGGVNTRLISFASDSQEYFDVFQASIIGVQEDLSKLNTSLSAFSGSKAAAEITSELNNKIEDLGEGLKTATDRADYFEKSYRQLQGSIRQEVDSALNEQTRESMQVAQSEVKETTSDVEKLTSAVSTLAKEFDTFKLKLNVGPSGGVVNRLVPEDVDKFRELLRRRAEKNPQADLWQLVSQEVVNQGIQNVDSLIKEMVRLDSANRDIWARIKDAGVEEMKELKYRLVGDPIVTDMVDDVDDETERMRAESSANFEGMKTDAIKSTSGLASTLSKAMDKVTPFANITSFLGVGGAVLAGHSPMQQVVSEKYLGIHRELNQTADRVVKNSNQVSSALDKSASITQTLAEKTAQAAENSEHHSEALSFVAERLESQADSTKKVSGMMTNLSNGVKRVQTDLNEYTNSVTQTALAWSEVGKFTAQDFVRLQRELATTSQQANVLLTQSKLNTDANRAAYKAEQRILLKNTSAADSLINRIKKIRGEIEVTRAKIKDLDLKISDAETPDEREDLKEQQENLKKNLEAQRKAAQGHISQYNELLDRINKSKQKAVTAGVQAIYDVALLDRSALRNVQEAATIASIGSLRGSAERFGVAAQEGLAVGLQAVQKDFTSLYFRMEDIFDGSMASKITSFRNVLFGAGKAGNVFARAMDFAADMVYDESDAVDDASYSAELLADNLTQSARRYDTAIADIAQSLKTQGGVPKRVLNDVAQGANRAVKEFSRLTENIRTGSDTWKGQLGNVRAYTRNLIDSIKLLENQEIIDPAAAKRLADLRESIERTNEQGILTIVERMRRAEKQSREWEHSILSLAGVFERLRFQLNKSSKRLLAGITTTFLYGFGFIAGAVKKWVNGVLGAFSNMYRVAVGRSIIPDMVRAIIGWFKHMVVSGGNLAKRLTKVVLSPFRWLKNRVSNVFRDMANSFRFVFDISDIVYRAIDQVRQVFNRFKEVNTIVQDTSVTIRGMMTGIKIDSEKALKGYMAFIDEMAQATPFEKVDIMEQVSRLFVFELDPRDWFQPIVNAAAAVGKPMKQFVNALAKLQTQGGSAMGDAVRMLADYGINANRVTGWVNTATGKVLDFDEALRASEDASYAASKGYKEISFAEARVAEDVETTTLALQAYLVQDVKFAAAAEARSKTLSGVLSNITDSTDVLMTAFGEPIWQKITDILLEIFESIQKNSKEMVVWATILGNDVVKIIEKAWDKFQGLFLDTGPPTWLINMAAILRKLANGEWKFAWDALVNIVKKQISKLLTFLNAHIKDAVKWGIDFVKQIAKGIIKASSTILRRAVKFVGRTISRFLEPHSPPEEGPLSTIDIWGERLMNVFTGSFGEADLSTLDTILSQIRDKFTDTSAYKGVRGTVMRAIAEINKTGTIQGNTWTKLENQLAGVSKATSEYVKAQLKLKAVSKEVADAEAAGFIPKELQDKLDAAKMLVSIKEDNLALEEQVSGEKTEESSYKEDYKKEKQFLEKKRKLGLLTNEEYYSELASLEERYIDQAIEAGETAGLEKRAALVKEYENKIAEIRAKEAKDDLKKQYKMELDLLKKKHEMGLISEEEYISGLLSAEESYVEGSIEVGVLHGLDKHIAKIKELRARVNKETTSDSSVKDFDANMRVLEKRFKYGLISEEEYLKAKIDFRRQYMEDALSGDIDVDNVDKFIAIQKKAIAELELELAELQVAGKQTPEEFIENIFGDFAGEVEEVMAEIDSFISEAEDSMSGAFEGVDLEGQFNELGTTISDAFKEAFELDFDGISNNITGIFQPVIDAATWLNKTGVPLIEKWFGKISDTAKESGNVTKAFFYPEGGGGKNRLQLWLDNILDTTKQWVTGIGTGLIAWLPLLLTNWRPIVDSLKKMFSGVSPAIKDTLAPIKVAFDTAMAPIEGIVGRAKDKVTTMSRLAVVTGNVAGSTEAVSATQTRLAAVTGNTTTQVATTTGKISKFQLAIAVAKESIATLIRSVGAFGKSIARLFSWSTLLWTAIIVGIAKNKEKLAAAFDDIVGLARDAMNKIVRLLGFEDSENGGGIPFKKLGVGVIGYIGNLFSAIGDLFDAGLFEPIGTFFGGFIDLLTGSMKQLYGIFDAIIGVGAILTGNWSLAKESFKSAFATFKEGIGELISGNVDIFASFVDLVPRLVLSLVATIADMFGATAFADWIRGIRENVSEGILTFFDTVTEKVKEYVASIAERAGIFQKLREVFDNLTTKFAEIKEKLTEPIAKLREAFSRLKKTFSKLWEELKPTLIALGEKLYELVGPLWEALQPILEKLGKLLSALPLGVLAIAIGAVLLPVLGMLFGVITALVYGIENFVDGLIKVVDGITTTFSGVIEIITGFVDIVTGVLSGDGQLIIDGFWEIVDGIENVFVGLWETIKGLFQVSIGNIISLIWGFVEGFLAPFEVLVDTLVGNSIIPDMVEDIIYWFEYLVDKSLEIADAMIDGIVRIFKRLTYEVIPVVKDFVLEVIGVVSDIQIRILDLPFFEAGKDLIGFLVDGISAALPDLDSMAEKAADTVWSYFNFGSPADEGPLSKEIAWDAYLSDYDGSGMENQFEKIGDKIIKVFELVGKEITSALEDAADKIIAAFSATKQSTVFTAQSMSDKRISIENDTTDKLTQAWEAQASRYQGMADRMMEADRQRAINAESLRYTELANAYNTQDEVTQIVDNSNVHEINSNLNRAQQAAASRYTELANTYQTMDSVKTVVDDAYTDIKNTAKRTSDEIVNSTKRATEIQKATMSGVMNHYRNIAENITNSWVSFVARLQAGEWRDWRGEWHSADEPTPGERRREVPEFATGAWNLPRDMVAKIHSGEMIIPKEAADVLRKKTAMAGRPSEYSLAHLRRMYGDGPRVTAEQVIAQARSMKPDNFKPPPHETLSIPKPVDYGGAINTNSNNVTYNFNAGAMAFPNVNNKNDATGIMAEVQNQIKMGSLKGSIV